MHCISRNHAVCLSKPYRLTTIIVRESPETMQFISRNHAVVILEKPALPAIWIISCQIRGSVLVRVQYSPFFLLLA